MSEITIEKMKKNLEEKHGLKWKDFQKFKYAGGRRGRHLNYYTLLKKTNKDLPELKDIDEECKCPCEHDIKENCFVMKDDIVIVLGNCCIKKFMEKSGRSCDTCGNPHKNRKVNQCNQCRKSNCANCNVPLPHYKYIYCHSCFILKKISSNY